MTGSWILLLAIAGYVLVPAIAAALLRTAIRAPRAGLGRGDSDRREARPAATAFPAGVADSRSATSIVVD